MTATSLQHPESRLLIVDDEPDVRHVWIKILRKFTNHNLDVAADGKEALEKWQVATVEGEPYDLIVADLRMPHVDGETLISEIRKIDQEVAFIVLSGHGDLSEAYTLLEEYQISDFLYKPLEHPKVLLFSIKNALEKQRLKRELQSQNNFLEQCIQLRTEELAESKKQAELANHTKSQFIGKMNHEFRTPLNAIMGFGQLLSEKSKSMSLPPEFHQHLKNICISGQVLTELVNSVLEFSEIEADKVELIEGDLELSELIRNLSKLYGSQAREKGVEFGYRVDPDLPKWIRTDRTKLTQVLMHVLGNAIKFTQEGREVEFHVKRERNTLVFVIIDEGIGIPIDRQDAIFDFFEQADQSIANQYGGTGLGLALSKQLTEMLGGKITLSSRIGAGSTFYVSLPFDEVLHEEKTVEPRRKRAGHIYPDKKILVVEDNMLNQALIKDLLDMFGVEVVLANDGQRGVEKALEYKPDLILMDLRMPVMDGVEATRQILSHPEVHDTPIVAVTGDAFAEQQHNALEAGMVDFLVKPFMIEELQALLEKHLPSR